MQPAYHDLPLAQGTLRLLPELAAVWLEEQTLFLADVHLGRSAANRSAGIFMPQGTDTADLQRITQLINEHTIQRVIILGDLFHARRGMTSDTIAHFGNWISQHNAEIILVEGNHDRNARRYDPGTTSSRTTRRTSRRSDSVTEAFVKSFARKIGTKTGDAIVRGILGGLFKSR